MLRVCCQEFEVGYLETQQDLDTMQADAFHRYVRLQLAKHVQTTIQFENQNLLQTEGRTSNLDNLHLSTGANCPILHPQLCGSQSEEFSSEASHRTYLHLRFQLPSDVL